MKTSSWKAGIKGMEGSERHLVVTLTGPKRLEDLQNILKAQLEECEEVPDIEVRIQSYSIAEDSPAVWATDAHTRQADHLVSSVVIFIADKPTDLQHA